jgi:ribosome-associated toxin RatA of RatAB toxin-antitoxin module
VKRAIALGLAGALCRAAAAASNDITTRTEASADAPTYVAEGIVDAPPARVWALVSKCADYVKNMPSVAASEELSREGDERTKFTTVCQVTFDAPFPFSDLVSVSRATMTVDAQSGVYTRAWTLIRGDYDVNDGSWRLAPVDGGAKTQVTYRIHAKPKLPLPDSLIATAQQQTLPQVIERLRERTAQEAQRAPR